TDHLVTGLTQRDHHVVAEHAAGAGDDPPERGHGSRPTPRRSQGCPLLQRLPPGAVLPVPGHGLRQAGLEVPLRRVPELLADLRPVDRVATVVTLAVLDVLDAVPGRATGGEQPVG